MKVTAPTQTAISIKLSTKELPFLVFCLLVFFCVTFFICILFSRGGDASKELPDLSAEHKRPCGIGV